MTTDRTTFTAALRLLADTLDNTPLIPLPYEGVTSTLTWFVYDDLAEALALRDLMTDPTTAHGTSTTFPVQITGTIGGLKVLVYVAAAVALVDPATAPPRWPALVPALAALLDTPAAVSA